MHVFTTLYRTEFLVHIFHIHIQLHMHRLKILHIWNILYSILVGIFVSGTYMAIPCEVGFIFAYTCENVGSISPCSMLTLEAIFGIWQPDFIHSHIYIWSICYIVQWYVLSMFTVLLVAWLMPVTSCVVYICAYIPYICMSSIWHICPIW